MEIEVSTKNGSVKGRCDENFRPLLDEFVRNFDERNELGASLCVNVGGETRVDLWGGQVASRKEAKPWEEDTVSVVFSCTKAATALCAHLLIDQGKLDLHAPVVKYWPEFACNGKEQASVAMLLNHSVGVPALRKPVEKGGFCDWDYMVDRLAQEEPFWMQYRMVFRL